MNILYLTQIFSSTRGGGPLVFYDLSKELTKHSHNVHIICNLTTESSNSNLFIHKIRPYLKESNFLPPSILQNLSFILNSVLFGIQIIDKFNIQIIHTNSFIPVIAGSILGKVKNIPVIASIYDVFSKDDYGGWKRWKDINNFPFYYALLGNLMEKISLRMPLSLVHTISRATLSDIIEMNPKRSAEVIYPSINADNFQSKDQIEYQNSILYIGRLVFYKNVDILINAFKFVVQDIPDAKLYIIGDGPMKKTWMDLVLVNKLQKNVIFLGNITHSEKIMYLNKCSCLALPSTFEGFGLVILESFIMRKPVLVSNNKPFDEIVEDSIEGFLLSPSDPYAWAEKIKLLLLNKRLCKIMGERGWTKYNQKFEFYHSIENMEKLYEKLIK